MKNSYFISLVLLTLSASCTKQAPLSGTVELRPDDGWHHQVYLIDPVTFDGLGTSYMGKILDSASIGANGSFSFDKMPDAAEPSIVQIAVQKEGERYPNKLENEEVETSNYFPLVWKNGTQIVISAVADHFQNSFSIQDPSSENAAMLRLRDTRMAAFQQLHSGKEVDIHNGTNLLAQEKAVLQYQKSLMAFATESPDLLSALTAIRWAGIDGNYERIPEFIYGQCQKWKQARPDHPWVAQLCQKGSREALPVLEGDAIPDFPLPMLSGDTLALMQLLGQRLTILDLWASWCAPCRLENRNYLVPLWEKYHQEGFEIIGYALDADRSVWQNAMNKDGASRWPQASHLRGDDSPLFEALRISTIPANFLLDAEGKVIGKNLHGEELVQFVDGFMKQ